MSKKINNPIFSIAFKRGIANRHRLPFSEFVAALREIEKMIAAVGVQIQREHGVEKPDGDFGLQILGTATGAAFKRGSVITDASPTKDVPNAILAIGIVIGTTDSVEHKRVASVNSYGEPILRGLSTIAHLQEKIGTEMRLRLNGSTPPQEAVFSERGAKVLEEMAAADFAVEAVTLYGKLRRLMDYSRDDDEGSAFWGELREDGGREWRIKFKQSELGKVQKLFTKQVVVTGNATHFKTKHPRIDALEINEEKPRDYLAAFNRFRKNYSDVWGDEDSDALIREIRG